MQLIGRKGQQIWHTSSERSLSFHRKIVYIFNKKLQGQFFKDIQIMKCMD